MEPESHGGGSDAPPARARAGRSRDRHRPRHGDPRPAEGSGARRNARRKDPGGMSAAFGTDERLFDEEGRGRLRDATRMLWVLAAMVVAFLVWTWFAALDEVATGTGKVVPTSHEQVLQSLEGGILAKLHVRQDDIVKPGQVLAQLDPTQAGSTVEEGAAKYRAALAAQARLRAEVDGTPLRFPRELNGYPALKAEQQRLY